LLTEREKAEFVLSISFCDFYYKPWGKRDSEEREREGLLELYACRETQRVFGGLCCISLKGKVLDWSLQERNREEETREMLLLFTKKRMGYSVSF
jgi:hypothetical protein